jgi:hypothetical protein
MVLGGLWHGNTWTFVIWGALHGTYLLINHGWRAIAERRGWGEPGAWTSRGYVVLTYFFFIVSLALFRAHTFAGGLRYLQGLFAGEAHLPRNWGRSLAKAGWLALPEGKAPITWGSLIFDDMGQLPSRGIGLAALTLVLVWTFPSTNELMFRTKPVLQRVQAPTGWRRLLCWNRTWYHALITVTLFVICLLNLTNVSEFIYWQF